jgi:TP901 family phage tail tape measure protein
VAKALIVEIFGNAKQFGEELDRAAGKTRRFGAAAGVAGAAIAVGLAVALEKSVVAASKFQQEMELLHTQAGASVDEVNKMSVALRDMATSVGTTPDELAQGLYHVESAGLRGAKALEALKIAAEGAKIGGANLEDVTNGLNAVIVSGIKGSKNFASAMGDLNATVGAGDMRMQDLSDALGTGLPAKANLFGVSLKDISAALAVFGDNNIRGAEAGTQLASAIRLMGAPSAAAAKHLKEIGLSSTQLGTDLRSPGGLLKAMTDLKDHMEKAGLSATEQAALLSRAFGGRQAGGIMLLIDQLDRFKSKTEEVGKGATSFGESWKATTQTAQFASDQFHAAVSALAITVGTAFLPAAASMTQALANAIGYVVQNWPKIKLAIAPVMQQIEDIIRVVLADAEALWQRFGGTVMTVLKDYARIIQAVLTVAADEFRIFGDLLRGDWSKLWVDVKRIVGDALHLIGSLVRIEFDILKGLMTDLGTIAVHALADGLKALPGAMIKGLKAINTAITSAESWVFSEALKIGEQLVAGIVDGVKGLGTSLKNKVTGEISGAISGIKGAFHIHSPSQVTHDQIGVPLGEGVVEGWKTGIAPLSAIISDNLDSIFVAARARVAKGWADMLKETTKNAVPGVTTAGTIDAINAITSAQDAATQKIADYTAKYVDTSFATPGYTVGMSAIQVQALAGNQPESNPVTVNINGPVYGADSQQLAQSVQQEFLRMQAQGTVLGFA